MNRSRRNRIQKLISQLEAMSETLDEIYDEEEEAHGNLPESLQYSDRGEAMEEAMGQLDTARGSVEMLVGELEEIVQ